MYRSFFNFTIIVRKSILITHPHNIYCRITNNPLCIFYDHIILLTITGRFSKWGLLALNRVNNNRALFTVKSPIKIQSTLLPGLGQSLTLTWYSSGLTQFIWIRQFQNVLISIPPQLSDAFYSSSIRCSLLRCNGNCDFSNADVDQKWECGFM